MLLSLAVLITIALLLGWLFEKCRLPSLLGMMLAGALLGRYAQGYAQAHCSAGTFDWLSQYVFIHPALLEVSSELRTGALIVILLRAGLGIRRATLAQVGWPALWMSFVPSLIEGAVVMLAAHAWLGLSWVESGMLGFILAAVSPAVVVPAMLNLQSRQLGQQQGVPTLVLAGASVDDVFAITLFGAFLSMAGSPESSLGHSTSLAFDLAGIPISIVTGVGVGLLVGYAMVRFFQHAHLRDTKKVILLMVVAIGLVQIQQAHFFPFASLLGVMAVGFVILERHEALAHRMAEKFNKVWVFAELLLFVLIGAEVNLSVIGQSGLLGLAVLAVGLAGRSFGVLLSLQGSALTGRQRLFCVIAYLPKATVQAAIGGIALSLASQGQLHLSQGIATGELILAVAVLAIVVTAPLGAIGIHWSAPYLLDDPSDPKKDASAGGPSHS